MKRFSIIFGLICTITLIILMITLLILALVHNNKYVVTDSMVFIESVSGDSIKDGMGFVYKMENNNNYIVTNYHVVESSNYLYVYNLDDKRKSADLVWYDAYTDIAVLKVEDELGLEAVKTGVNDIRVNDEVYYFNISNKVLETGVVLSLDNEININASYGNSLYNTNSISANVVPGNSGGPLLNKSKEVIGMISLKDDESNTAFYLPIDYVMHIVSKLENNSLYRANLGATFINTTNIDLLNRYGVVPGEITGVVVLDIKEGYPLNVSGIINGDIITKVNDFVISDVNELQKEIYSHNMNDTVSIEFYRNNVLNATNVILSK